VRMKTRMGMGPIPGLGLKLLFLLIIVATIVTGCSEKIELPGDESNQAYKIDYSTKMETNFIPVLDVKLTGEPAILKVAMTNPTSNVTTKTIYMDDFKGDVASVSFRISEPGNVPPGGNYKIEVLNESGTIASRNIKLDKPKFEITDAKFNITGNTIHGIWITIENKGDMPGYVQQANIVVDGGNPKGWYFYESFEPKQSKTIGVDEDFIIKEDGSEVIVWIYYKAQLQGEYRTTVYPN